MVQAFLAFFVLFVLLIQEPIILIVAELSPESTLLSIVALFATICVVVRVGEKATDYIHDAAVSHQQEKEFYKLLLEQALDDIEEELSESGPKANVIIRAELPSNNRIFPSIRVTAKRRK